MTTYYALTVVLWTLLGAGVTVIGIWYWVTMVYTIGKNPKKSIFNTSKEVLCNICPRMREVLSILGVMITLALLLWVLSTYLTITL